MKKFLTTIFLLCMTLPWIRADISHTFSFDPEDFYTETRTIDSTNYALPRMQGLGNEEIEGCPSVPVLYATFAVPYEAENFRITVTPSRDSKITLDHAIAPSEYDVPIDEYTMGRRAVPYIKDGLSGIYPQSLSTVKIPARWCGKFQTLEIAVYPVEYNSGDGSLTFHGKMEIEISWDETGPGPLAGPGLTLTEKKRLDYLKETVLNPEVYRTAGIQRIVTPGDAEMPELPCADYVIITTDEMRDAFEILAAMRRTRGYSSAVYTMEFIRSLPQFADGDKISNINDDAGKLRAFLRYLYENRNTRYVLLGGKPPYVPCRTAKYKGKPVDTDMYFSELDIVWPLVNSEKNWYMNASDFPKINYGHLSVGRLPCSNSQEVLNYLNKLHRYENSPGKDGDASYLGKGMIAVSNSMFTEPDDKDYDDENYNVYALYNQLGRYFDSMTFRVQEQNTDLISGSFLIDDINTNSYGNFELWGHGCPFAIASTQAKNGSNPYGIRGIIALLDEPQLDYRVEENNGLDCLKNKYYPFFSYSASCTTMPFILHEELFYRPLDISYTFGESMVLGKDYGAIAYLGNTNVGYTSTSQNLRKFFYDGLYDKTNQFCLNEVGLLELKSKIQILSIDKYLAVTHNLLGDPVINLWRSEPENYNGYDLNAVSTWQSSAYKSAEYNYSLGNITRYNSTPSGFNSINTSTNSIRVFYGNNMIPYYLPVYLTDIDQLFDDRGSSNQKNTLFGKDFHLGNSADQSLECNLNLSGSKHLRIYSFGTVSFENPVTVENGATLEITSLNPVNLKNITIMENGKLIIKALTYSMDSGFEIRKGGVFEPSIITDSLF